MLNEYFFKWMNIALSFHFTLKWGDNSCDNTNEIVYVKAPCKMQYKSVISNDTISKDGIVVRQKIFFPTEEYFP